MTTLSRPGSLILLADDEAMLRNTLCKILEMDGYRVLAAADGAEALELSRVHDGPIDLLLTDLEMPRVGGISAYQHISARRPGIRVLFMSGRLWSPVKLPRSVPFLAKPFGLATLRSRIHDTLSTPPGDPLKVILVVDHDKTRGQHTKNILVDGGYAVITAASVEAAEAVSDTVARIDLIISGVVFPGLSGVHLAEHIEASKREISTLLVSHFPRDLLRNMSGFSRQPEFLPNPFTPEDLLGRVRRLLEV